jgi:hypothetical protein
MVNSIKSTKRNINYSFQIHLRRYVLRQQRCRVRLFEISSVRTTFKSHAQRTAEKQGRLRTDNYPILEDSAPSSTSYSIEIISLDSLHLIVLAYIVYTGYHIEPSAQTLGNHF